MLVDVGIVLVTIRSSAICFGLCDSAFVDEMSPTE